MLKSRSKASIQAQPSAGEAVSLPPAAHQLTQLWQVAMGSRRLMFISMMNGIPLGNLIFSLCHFGKTGVIKRIYFLIEKDTFGNPIYHSVSLLSQEERWEGLW